GERPASLSVDETKYYAAQFFLAPSTGTTYVDSSLAVIRKRVVLDGFHDWVTVINYGAEPAVLELVFDAGADFADLFEVKDATAGQKKGQSFARAEADRLVFGYERETFKRETWIRAISGSPEYREDGLRFSVTLRPQERWEAEIDVIPIADPTTAPELRSPSDWEDPSVRLGLRKW